MADFIITHRIEAPALTDALNNLADALRNRTVAAPVEPVTIQPAAEVVDFPVQTQPAEAPTVNPTVAPVTTPVNGPTPVTTTAPTVAAPTPAPVSETAPVTAETSDPAPAVKPAPAPAVKQVTYEDIVSAGGQLLEQGMMEDLMNLLKGYGVQAVTQLKPEQYPDVLAGLIKLGAKV